LPLLQKYRSQIAVRHLSERANCARLPHISSWTRR
jgi:hypothetical protein